MAKFCQRAIFIVLVAVFVSVAAADNSGNEAVNLPYPIDCGNNPYTCQWEPGQATPHCTVSGRLVFGNCGLQIAICIDKDEYDPSEKCLKP